MARALELMEGMAIAESRDVTAITTGAAAAVAAAETDRFERQTML